MTRNNLDPQTVENSVITYVREKARNPGAQLNANSVLLNSGLLDSIAILDLITFIEKEFGVTLTDQDLVPSNFETIASVVKMVCAR